jgi:hypothetical protein
MAIPVVRGCLKELKSYRCRGAAKSAPRLVMKIQRIQGEGSEWGIDDFVEGASIMM